MPIGPEPGPLLRSLVPAPDAIEPLSTRRLAAEAGQLPADPDEQQIALRIAYAVGDASVVSDVVCSAGAVQAGVEALRAGVAVVTDVRMVLAGVDRTRARQLGVSLRAAIDEPGIAAVARERGITRTAQGVLALSHDLDGAVVVIGNAPTALLALLDMIDAGDTRPALVIGIPVGYVAAAESKQELTQRDVPYITVRGSRGGTPMAVAALNTLLRMATNSDVPARVDGDTRIHVVGIGDDGMAGLGPRARELVEGAATIYGGVRQLELVPESGAQRVDIASGYAAKLEALASGGVAPGTVVLASGDPMLFGIGASIARRIGDDAASKLEVVPHVSSVQVLLARLGIASDGIEVLSVLARDLRPMLARAMASERFAVLLDRTHTASVVARALLDAGMEDTTAVVGERLEGASEQITRGRLSEIATREFDALSLLLVLRDHSAVAGYRRSAIPESEFAHRNGLITKAEVRALAVAMLRLTPDATLWDVGAGSGSVGIEAALGMPSGVVYAIERDPQQLAYIEQNRVTFRTPQVIVVAAEAPDGLETLPNPDAVFIGGGGAALPDILAVAMRRVRPLGRIVGTLATIDRVGPVLAQLRDWQPELREISIAHGVPLGDGTRLDPANPVFLFAATRPGSA